MKEIIEIYSTDPGTLKASILIALGIFAWLGYLALISRYLKKKE